MTTFWWIDICFKTAVDDFDEFLAEKALKEMWKKRHPILNNCTSLQEKMTKKMQAVLE